MSESTQRTNVEGLPKQFVHSLKILFDILDEDRSGYIRLIDIETRWHGEGVHGLPVGVIEALRKVTPASGFLSFDRFVMGLKLAMLKSKHNYSDSGKENRRTPTNEYVKNDAQVEFGGGGDGREEAANGGSVGIIQLHHISPAGHGGTGQKNFPAQQRTYGTAITATVRPNNAINTLNTGHGGLSDSNDRIHRVAHAKLSGNTNTNINGTLGTNNHATLNRDRYNGPPPPRPARTFQYNPQQHPSNPAPRKKTQPENPLKGPPQVPPRDYRKSAKNVIINELKQWQKERLRSQPDPHKQPRISSVSSDSRLVDKKGNPDYDIYVNVAQLPSAVSEEQLKDGRPTSKVQARRREPRRHTVANGVDYNMVKRMKQFEEEKDILRQGLENVEKARDWYLRQITSLEMRQRNFGNLSPNDVSVEESQERLNRLRDRITETNHCVKSLLKNSDMGVLGPMNLAMKTAPYSEEIITINMLKEQNRLLTKEVGDKGERITQLEREKASLIREMFEVRALAKNKSNYDDTTFM